MREQLAVRREDFDKLQNTVAQLAEAQKRTEQRVAELAEAQRRSDAHLTRLEIAVVELAEAQKRTEQRVEELAEAQKRTAAGRGIGRGAEAHGACCSGSGRAPASDGRPTGADNWPAIGELLPGSGLCLLWPRPAQDQGRLAARPRRRVRVQNSTTASGKRSACWTWWYADRRLSIRNDRMSCWPSRFLRSSTATMSSVRCAVLRCSVRWAIQWCQALRVKTSLKARWR